MLWRLSNSTGLRSTDDQVAARGRTAAPETAAHQFDGSPMQFMDLVDIVRRRGRIVLTLAAAGTALAMLLSLFIAPKYTAVAQLIVADNAGPEHAEPVSAVQLDERIDTHVAQIRSPDYLERVLDTLRREATKDGNDGQDTRSKTSANTPSPLNAAALLSSGSYTEQSSLDPREIVRRLTMWIGELRSAPRSFVPSIEIFQRNLLVMQERRSRIVSISYTAASPVKAALFANKVATMYLVYRNASRQDALQQDLAAIDERLSGFVARDQGVSGAAGAAGEIADAPQERTEQTPSRDAVLHTAEKAREKAGLLRKREELRRKLQSIVPEVSVLSLAAAPIHPSSHNPLLFIIPALMMLLIAGLWLAVLLERLDRTIRSQKQLSLAFGVRCIGLVPQLHPATWSTNVGKYLRSMPYSDYAESIRSIVATLQLAGPGRQCSVVLIASSLSGEGRTTLAHSLASYIAGLGHETLLLDLSSSRNARAVWNRDQKPGPDSDASADDATIMELIEYSPTLMTSCLRLGHLSGDPLALFASEEFGGLVARLRDRYKCVIIDGPPSLGFGETKLLVPFADQVLYAVKWGSTDIDTVRDGLDALFNSDAIGSGCRDKPVTILTQVHVSKRTARRATDMAGAVVTAHR